MRGHDDWGAHGGMEEGGAHGGMEEGSKIWWRRSESDRSDVGPEAELKAAGQALIQKSSSVKVRLA
eukprot:1774530-Pyramimonas_sp.AAC.1